MILRMTGSNALSFVIALLLAPSIYLPALHVQAVEQSTFGQYDGTGAANILAETSRSARLNAIKSLEPNIAYNLSGADIALILGDSKGSWRASMIQVLASHARVGLDGDEVAAIVNGSYNASKVEALKYIEPRIKYNLDITEFKKILGNSEGAWRGKMIGVLAEHAGAPSANSESSTGIDLNVTQSPVSSTANNSVSSELDLQIGKLSQKNLNNYYKEASFKSAEDKLEGSDKLYPIWKLSCLSTVYTMIEQKYGDGNARIDDFYDDPGIEKYGIGACIPSSSNCTPLSGRALNASFYEIERNLEYSAAKVVKSLKEGKLVILSGVREGGFPHFVLVGGYNLDSKNGFKLLINDPWNTSIAVVTAIDVPTIDGFSFNKMRIIQPN